MIITFGGCHLVEERSLFEDELHMMLDIPPGQIIQQLAPKLLKPTDLPRRHAGPEVSVRMEFSSTQMSCVNHGVALGPKLGRKFGAGWNFHLALYTVRQPPRHEANDWRGILRHEDRKKTPSPGKFPIFAGGGPSELNNVGSSAPSGTTTARWPVYAINRGAFFLLSSYLTNMKTFSLLHRS
jgi:hypothetical protein